MNEHNEPIMADVGTTNRLCVSSSRRPELEGWLACDKVKLTRPENLPKHTVAVIFRANIASLSLIRIASISFE